MKLSMRGDVPIIQMTFGTIMPDGVKDVVCIQTTHAHAERMAEAIGKALSRSSEMFKEHLDKKAKNTTKKKPADR